MGLAKYPALFDLFIETLKGLDNNVQKLLLLIIKTDMEYGYVADYATIEWEQKRFENVSNESTVTVQCKCENCNSLYPVLLNIFEFMQLPNLFKLDKGQKPMVQYLDCRRCEKNNCLAIVPFWIDITVGKNRKFIVPIKPIANS